MDINMLSRLQQAIIDGNLEEVMRFIAKGVEVNPITEHPPLCLASDKGHEQIVIFLLENGAQVDWDGESNIPVRPLEWAIRRNHIPIAKRLLDAGANVDVEDFMGESPLISAISYGCTEIVRLLLKKGAKVDQADMNNDTPLHWACSHQAGNMDMVKNLVQYGADPNCKNYFKQTPLMLAVDKNDILLAKLLIVCILLKNSAAEIPKLIKNNQCLLNYWKDKFKKIDYLKKNKILGVENQLKNFLYKVMNKKNRLLYLSFFKFVDDSFIEAQESLFEKQYLDRLTEATY